MAEADTDKDGKISKNEMMVWLRKQLEGEENEGYGQNHDEDDEEE
jgi:Ca2+-binding EF-hand superfamily protein